MKKILMIFLIFMLITPLSANNSIFDLNKNESILLVINSLSLFVALKNSFVLSFENQQSASRIMIAAFSYQTFIVITSYLIKEKIE
jgi:CDP-diglyceride synthetase